MKINLLALTVDDITMDLEPAIACKIIPYNQSPESIEEIAYNPSDGLLQFHDAANGCQYSVSQGPIKIDSVVEYHRKSKATGKGKGFGRQ